MFIESSAANGIATITLNRPDKLNAFTGTMREDLLAALRACENDESVRVVIITGAGRAFCAGGDVEFMASLQQTNDTVAFRRLLDAGRDVVLQIVAMAKPVIASINGVAAGAGCNLALACDLRIASETAKLSESFVKIGLHPDWGGTWLLPRLVGPSRAFELLTTARTVDAQEALAIGMVDRVVADLAAETMQLASAIAAASPIAIRGIKRALRGRELEELRAQLELEAEHQLACFASEEAREKIGAFAERRRPALP